jgi:hypothetical protein
MNASALSAKGASEASLHSAAMTKAGVTVLPGMRPIPVQSERVRRRAMSRPGTVPPRRERRTMRRNRRSSPAQVCSNKAATGSAFEVNNRAMRTCRQGDPRGWGRH